MFALSGRNLPRVYCYKDAVKVYEESHIHERMGGERGLTSKRDTSKTIRKNKDEYQFKYHSTALVIWTPTKLMLQCYDSQSSVTFASAFLPLGLSVSRYKGEMYIVQDGKWYQPKVSHTTFHHKDGKYTLDMGTVATVTHYDLDKKRAAGIRKVLKPLREQRDLLLRLRNGNHRAYMNDTTRLFRELKLAIDRGAMDDVVVRDLLQHIGVYDDEALLGNAYLLGGAVNKRTAIGERKSEPKWAKYPASRFVDL